MTMRTDDRGSGLAGIIALLAAFIGTAMVAGLIGAGLFMPSVGAAGATARSGVDFFDALPTEFEQSPLAQQSRILDADGHVIATFYNENRIVVPLKKVAKIMQNAQIAIEDTRFREHGGIDPKGVLRAAVSNAQSGDSGQGASTLTQQYVKLTLQENALSDGDDGGRAGRRQQELRAQDPGDEVRDHAREEDVEGPDPRGLPEHRLLRRRRVRRRDRRPALLLHHRRQADAAAGRPCWPASSSSPGRFDPRKNPKAALAGATSCWTACCRPASSPRSSTTPRSRPSSA